jgi:8-oxo-dGTP diphosphatase
MIEGIGVRVDVVVLTICDGELSARLIRREREPFAGAWAVPGGAVGPGEELDEAARRRAGLVGGHLEQLRTYGGPRRDPRGRVVSVAYLGMIPCLTRPPWGGWFPVHELPPLAFDHGVILADGIERARAKLEYSSLATAFCAGPFTLADLRHVYETVWGVRLDGANFRRKVLSTPGLVEPLRRRSARIRGGRPAQLYRRGPAGQLHPAMLRPSC